jgi:polar amino acid transport system substrate-binding protein
MNRSISTMNKVLLVLLQLLLPVSVMAQPEKIILSFIDRAPYYYLDEGNPRGFLLEWQIEVLERAGISYKLRQSTAKGILNRIRKNSSPICSIGWFKNPERQSYGNFTDAIYQNKPLVILTRSKDGRFEKFSQVSDLFLDNNLILGVNRTFSYGQVVDALLEKIQPPLNEVDSLQKNLIHMLNKGRFDYMLIAPEEINSLLLNEDFDDSDFIIRDFGLPPGNKRYLFCSKKVPYSYIEKINGVIKIYPVPQKN